jgi:hypothetical protein
VINVTEKKVGGITGKGFVKGDARINRKGRPKDFDALRKLAQQIGHEDATGSDGQPILIDGKPVTATEIILRSWATSLNPALQIKFMEVAYGKVPDPIELTGKNGGPVEVSEISLTDEQRAARAAALLDRARARRARPPADS